jgi:hypothetical protein
VTQTVTRGVTTSHATRNFGYLVAIAVNVTMLVVVNNLLAWGWLPFLTTDFADVLWLIDISLLATITVNLIYLWFDPSWVKSIGQMTTGAISIVVLARMLQVFPFDFSGATFDWSMVTRVVLVFGLIGTATGMLVGFLRLVAGLTSSPPSRG